MANEEELSVILSLKDAFSKQIVSPIKQMQTLGKAFDGLARSAKLAGGIIAGSIALTARSVMQQADQLVHLNQIYGISIDKLQKLGFAAELNGSNMNELGVAFRQLSRSAEEASTGSKEYADVFKKLGVSVKDSSGQLKNTEALFDEVATALGKITNPAEQTSLAMQLLGRAGQNLIPLMKQGAQGFDALGKVADELGITMKTETVEALEAFGDQMNVAKKIGQAFVSEGLLMIANNLPLIIEGFFEFTKEVNRWKNETVRAFKDIAAGSEFLMTLLGIQRTDDQRGYFEAVRQEWNKLGATATRNEREAQEATKDSTETLEEYKQKVLEAFRIVKEGAGEKGKAVGATTTQVINELEKATGTLFEAQKKSLLSFRATGDEAKRLETNVTAAKMAVEQLTEAYIADGEVTPKEIEDIRALQASYDHAATALQNFKDKQDAIKRNQEQTAKLFEEAKEFNVDFDLGFSPEQLQQIAQYAQETQQSIHGIFHTLSEMRDADPMLALEKALRDTAKEATNLRVHFSNLFRGMEGAFSNAFEQMMQTGAKLKNVMKQLFRDIKTMFIKMIADIMAQQVMKQIVGLFLPGAGGGGAPGLSVGGAAAGGAAGAQTAAALPFGSAFGMAAPALGMGLSATGAGGGASFLGVGGIEGSSLALAGAGVGLAVGQQSISSGNVAMSAGSMALAGASLGAFAGPIGMAVGAVVGAAYGWYAGDREKKKMEKQKEAQEAAMREQERLIAEQKQKAADLFEMELGNQFSGGLATREQASAIGEIMSGDVDAGDLERLGVNWQDVMARQGQIEGQAAVNNITTGAINVNLQVGSIASGYDIRNVAQDMGYHLVQALNEAAAGD